MIEERLLTFSLVSYKHACALGYMYASNHIEYIYTTHIHMHTHTRTPTHALVMMHVKEHKVMGLKRVKVYF